MILRRSRWFFLTELRTGYILSRIGGVLNLQEHCLSPEGPSKQELLTLQKRGLNLGQPVVLGSHILHRGITQKCASDYHRLIYKTPNELAEPEGLGFGKTDEHTTAHKPSEHALESSGISWNASLAPVSKIFCQTPLKHSDEILKNSKECGIDSSSAKEWACTNQTVNEHKEQDDLEWRLEYPSLLRSCGRNKTLSLGKQVHHALCCDGMENDTYIGVVLVEMYLKCEAIEDAHLIFFSLRMRSTFSWNLVIRSYTSQGQDAEACLCLQRVLAEADLADKYTYVSVLSSCISLTDMGATRKIHTCIMSGMHQSDIVVSNALINAYIKCGSIIEAQNVFDMMSERDSFSWDTLICAYSQHKLHHQSLWLLCQQQQEGVLPTKITYVAIINTWASQGVRGETSHILVQIFGSEFKHNANIQAAVTNLFGQIGSQEDAWRMFCEIRERNAFSWNVILASCHDKGMVELYSRMQQEGILPGEETFIRIISLCGDHKSLQLGKYMHACSINSPYNLNIAIGNALISMYSRCAGLKDAYQAFNWMAERSIVSSTAMVGAYVEHGQAMLAIELFDHMLGEGLLSDKIMLISIFNACASLHSPARIKRLHARIVCMGLDFDHEVGSCLVSVYGRCGSLKAAERMFNLILDRNTSLWTAMMYAYATHNHPGNAIQFFRQMKQEGILPNEVTFFCVLDACAKLFNLAEGRRLHAHIASSRFYVMSVKTTLIDMYGRCGSLEESQRVFDDVAEQDIVLLTAMMSNYTQSGKVKQALLLFDKALQKGVKPDEVAYVNVLSMCNHAGLVEEGRRYFFSMNREHRVKPNIHHYSCMIDLYGRAGYLREAEDMLTNMPFTATALQWMTLLSACRHQLDKQRGERAARHVMLLEPKDPTPYLELFNIYNALNREAEAAAVLNKIKGLL